MRVCPSCAQKFQRLAQDLPWSKHVHSKLVCSITRELMNEHNPPMVLPNGAVYSERAVQQVASRNHGIFTCPKTGASLAAAASPLLSMGDELHTCMHDACRSLLAAA